MALQAVVFSGSHAHIFTFSKLAGAGDCYGRVPATTIRRKNRACLAREKERAG